jgi:hypothetical protein
VCRVCCSTIFSFCPLSWGVLSQPLSSTSPVKKSHSCKVHHHRTKISNKVEKGDDNPPHFSSKLEAVHRHRDVYEETKKKAFPMRNRHARAVRKVALKIGKETHGEHDGQTNHTTHENHQLSGAQTAIKDTTKALNTIQLGCFGFWVSGFGSQVLGALGLLFESVKRSRLLALPPTVKGTHHTIQQCLVFRVLGFRFRVSGSGFRGSDVLSLLFESVKRSQLLALPHCERHPSQSPHNSTHHQSRAPQQRRASSPKLGGSTPSPNILMTSHLLSCFGC